MHVSRFDFITLAVIVGGSDTAPPEVINYTLKVNGQYTFCILWSYVRKCLTLARNVSIQSSE